MARQDRKTLETILRTTHDYERTLKGMAVSMRARLTSPTRAPMVREFAGELKTVRDRLTAALTAPGLAAYAQEAFEDNTIDIVAEMSATRDEIDLVLAWIVANLPSDGTHVLEVILEQDGSSTEVLLQPNTMAQLRQRLAALINVID